MLEEVRPTKLYTWDEAKLKDVLVGTVFGNEFVRTVKKNHFMVKHSGYGIQLDVLERLPKMGVKYIKITTPSQKKYRIPLATWLSKGKLDDQGHGKQVFLDKKYYEQNNTTSNF